MHMADSKPTPRKKPTKPKTPKAPAPGSMADIMDRKKRAQKKIYVQLDGDVKDRIEQANLNVIKARQVDRKSNAHVKAEPAAQRIYDELVAASKDSEVPMTFGSIGRVKYEALVRKHSDISDEQRKAGLDVDMPNFAPALLAACAIDPKITLKEAKEIWDSPEWNAAECDRMFVAARDVNSEIPDIPLSSEGIEQILSSILK
jgi:hypothetical protein